MFFFFRFLYKKMDPITLHVVCTGTSPLTRFFGPGTALKENRAIVGAFSFNTKTGNMKVQSPLFPFKLVLNCYVQSLHFYLYHKIKKYVLNVGDFDLGNFDHSLINLSLV